MLLGVVVHLGRQRNLAQIALALRLPRRLTRILNRGQQQRRQHPNEADDDKKFDDGEAAPPMSNGTLSFSKRAA
jgi:hypothetical protein